MFRQAGIIFLSLFIVVTQAEKSAFVQGQLKGTSSSAAEFAANTELIQFQADGELKGFKHENGRLIVQMNGYYYIYAQVFFESYPDGPQYHNRVGLAISGNAVSLMQTGLGGMADYGSLSTDIVKYLMKDDYISLKTVYPSKLWVANAHTFFGAYRISK